jgi:hypothetical protein
MKPESNDFIQSLSPHLFWDVEMSKVEPKQSKLFLIGRVLEFGFTKDWVALLKFYGVEEIKKSVVKLRNLDDVSLHFASSYFDIKLEDFRCYTKRQLAQNFWDY